MDFNLVREKMDSEEGKEVLCELKSLPLPARTASMKSE